MTPLRKRMIEDMRLRGFSARTQRSYVRSVRLLAEHYSKSPDKITDDELHRYFVFVMEKKGWSRRTMTVALCGIKFFYEKTLGRDWTKRKIVRPKLSKKLPVVLSSEEVRKVVSCVKLLHDWVCLTTIYACGLRLSEGASLKVGDIDSSRMMVHGQHAGRGRTVLRYLARYVHRVAITQTRIESHRSSRVTFRYRDRKKNSMARCNLHDSEFIRRFLQHVLPPGFHKVRYFGILSPGWTKRLAVIQHKLGEVDQDSTTEHQDGELPHEPAEETPKQCPFCHEGHLVFTLRLPRQKRGPPWY